MNARAGSGESTRAVCLLGSERVEVREVPLALPARGEVRVRLEGCGVCASNLPVWEGREWFGYPLAPGAPGHEGWGRIDALGEDVSGFEVGERVALLSQQAYAQHDFAGTAQLVKVPPELNDVAFPGEPLACAVNIFARSRISAGERIAIVGIGFLGAALTRLATDAGAEVIALSRRPFALRTAERLGARAAIGLTDSAQAIRQARELSGDGGFRCVIECVGSQDALDIASELTATRARLVIAGYHQDGTRKIDLQRWNWQGLDVVNAHEREPAVYRSGMLQAARYLQSGTLRISDLFTHEFELTEAAVAFDTLARRPDGFLKAWIRCS
jgi:2-desacetyl-2-hydroxyethyl bacteriochlorophyllide A dehydrogenase